MIYVVTSFDFGFTSSVRIHAATTDAALAQSVYASVVAAAAAHEASRSGDSARMLVELTPVPADQPLLGADALMLFWGGTPGAQTNNAA